MIYACVLCKKDFPYSQLTLTTNRSIFFWCQDCYTTSYFKHQRLTQYIIVRSLDGIPHQMTVNCTILSPPTITVSKFNDVSYIDVITVPYDIIIMEITYLNAEKIMQQLTRLVAFL